MTTIVDAPARADGLQLLGTMVGSGYRTPPALVRRGDGQTLQLTPVLYQVLQAVDGHRSCAEVATVVREAMRRDVSAEMVATLVDQHLRPLGLLRLADGTEPPVKRSNPLLALRLKFAVTDPRATRRLTDPFRILFRPAVTLLVVLAFLAVTWWVFFHQGLAPAAYDAFQRPHLLLLVFGVTVLSAGFHEFGHAAAARYGGADPGVIGAGVYLVWPAFYTDVTDSYRLGKRGRVRTDLGGLYFNAVVVVLTFVWWYLSGWEALLLVVATQILQMVQQLMPMLRFDGYHLLADLTGVPDLYTRIRPTLLGLLPHRWFHPEHRVLKPWARLAITTWVLVTVPLMAFMLLTLVTSLPRVLGTAWGAVREDSDAVALAWREGGPVDVTAHALEVLAVALPVLAGLMILVRIGRRWTGTLVTWSRGSAVKRVAAVVVVSVVATALSWAWAPRPGNYRPITPDEKGLLLAALPGAQADPASAEAQRPRAVPARAVSTVGDAATSRLADTAPLQATFEAGRPLPTRSAPRLAMVLVPVGSPRATANPTATPTATPTGVPTPVPEPTPAGEPAATAGAADAAEPWVFPFDKPLPPAEGDNQAGAYNTTDDNVTYDVAFALVWATGDEVRNVNEAHAYASCSNCVTVAVAFQVVLILDDARVVVPQNLAVAANYDCYRCITAALASQLVLSVQRTPDEQQLLALGDVWRRLTELGRTLTSYSLTDVAARLDGFKQEITAILDAAPQATSATDATSTEDGPSSGPSPTSAPGTDPPGTDPPASTTAPSTPSATGPATADPSTPGSASPAPATPTSPTASDATPGEATTAPSTSGPTASPSPQPTPTSAAPQSP